MQSKISKKAKNLARLMALTAAICVCAIAVAVVLFFDSWQIGIVALAVGVASGAATALVFMLYKAARRAEKLNMQARRDLEALDEAFTTWRERPESATADRIEESGADSKFEDTSSEDENFEKASAESGQAEETSADERPSQTEISADGKRDFTTLEMRPPRFLMSVEDAKTYVQNSADVGAVELDETRRAGEESALNKSLAQDEDGDDAVKKAQEDAPNDSARS